jgi:hypothetical protein
MCGIVFSGVLHSEVIKDEAGGDWPCVVSSKAGRVFAR